MLCVWSFRNVTKVPSVI